MSKTIFWDFDGVLMDSMEIRNDGFRKVLKGYPEHQIDELMQYHLRNGGLSRYVKFRYFYEKILGEEITASQVNHLAEQFSSIMLESLMDKSLLISDSLNFVIRNSAKINMHIVSGSDGKELNQICQTVGIAKYFISIHGSPTPKTDLVQDLLALHKYDLQNCLLIGDSTNDYQAAEQNDIKFFGYNNPELRSMGNGYIDSFSDTGWLSE